MENLSVRRFAAALAAVCLLAVSATASPRAVHTLARLDPGSDTAERLHEVLLAYTANERYSGSALLARDGDILLHAAYGYFDRESGRVNTPATPFNIGSVGKLFTQALVLERVESGNWSLEQTVAELWPDSGIPRAGEITLRQLLSHRSGLGNYFGHPDYSLDQRSLSDFIALVRSQQLAFEPPGSDTFYSNSAYWVLAAALERYDAQDRDWRTILGEEVFQRAGMTEYRWFQPDEEDPDRPTGYLITPAGERLDRTADEPRPGPDGGLYTTAGDLWRFAAALREGEWYGDGLYRTSLEITGPFFPEGCDFALTFEVCSLDGMTLVTKGGTTTGGGAEVVMFEHEGHDYTLVLLANLSNAPLFVFRDALAWALDRPGARLPGERLGPALHRAIGEGRLDAIAAAPRAWMEEAGLVPDALEIFMLAAHYRREGEFDKARELLNINLALFDGHPPSSRLLERMEAQ